jgi:hypothetical protein
MGRSAYWPDSLAAGESAVARILRRIRAPLRTMISGSACHYCGEQQPKRKLRPLELTTAGDVLVCREIEACHRRARARLYTVPPVAATGPSGTTPERRRRRFRARWALWLTLILIGLLVLPHFTIGGRQWHFWLI